MANTSKTNLMTRRDVAYYRQRQKNRVFTALIEFFAAEAERRGLTKKELANLLSKEPSQITRWLSAPSNFELDTLSDILLAMGAEMDHRIVRFEDRAKPNYMHPLIARHAPQQVTSVPQIIPPQASLPAAVPTQSVPSQIPVLIPSGH
jgi:hypothetical protein